jgi:hypothetical protein
LDRKVGNKFLIKTLKILKKISKLGYNGEINTVVRPLSRNTLEQEKVFKDLQQILMFAVSGGVNKVKFIELDSDKTFGKPFIEKLFLKMFKLGYLDKFILKENFLNKMNINNYLNNNKIFSLKRGLFGDMGVFVYRTHCPTTFLNSKIGINQKKCEFCNGGELHLDFKGRSFLCQKNSSFNNISLAKSVRRFNIKSLEQDILKINKAIIKQKCNFN